MIKIYALFGDKGKTSPFKLDREAAGAAIRQKFTNVRSYRQFQRTPEQLDDLELAPYSASAELWLDDNEDPAELVRALESAATSVPEVFAVNPALVVRSQEHNILGKHLQDSGFKATFLFNRKPSMALAYFHAYWRNHHGPIAAKTQHAQRYVQSHISDPRRSYDGITELFWADHDTALASMASQQMTVDQSSDARNFVDGESLVVFLAQETP